jgi:hypothetical protein
MVTLQVRETVDGARVRLAAKARQQGVKLTRGEDGRHYASSTSTPGKLHYVTGLSCDCRGFIAHGRCKHHSALLSALGWLQSDPETDPEMNTAAPPTTATYVTGQRLRIVDGPLSGKSAVVIHHDPNPNAKLPIEARTGRAGTITNLFAANEVALEADCDEHKAVRMECPSGPLARKVQRLSASTPPLVLLQKKEGRN